MSAAHSVPAAIAALSLPLLLTQSVLGLRVLARLLLTAGGERIEAADHAPDTSGTITAVVPVLNEYDRLGPCLDGLMLQGPSVREILVIDGGSEDGTADLVRRYEERDARVRLIDATPIPSGWNGKAWGLQVGLREANHETTWLLTIDADVRPRPLLASSVVAHAARSGLAVLSVATEQELSDDSAAMIHPSLLATLVYRFGIPGRAAREPADVQANGQCMLLRRDVLMRAGGFTVARASLCEDVTLARALATAGWPVGFFESDSLVSTHMYTNGWQAFSNWTRSLPMHDRLAAWPSLLGLTEVALTQALPLPLVWLLSGRPHGAVGRWLLRVNLILLVTRLGILVGTSRAYPHRPWTYWLSPLLDVPVAIQLWRSVLRRDHAWRGRAMVTGDGI
jgi:dolichol-phosphate mannosyltransferase